MLMLLTLMADQLMKMEESNDTRLGGAGDSGDSGDTSDNSDSSSTSSTDDGGQTPTDGPTYEGDWYQGTSEDVYGDPSLAAFKDDDGKINGTNVLKSYVHGQREMGKDKVNIPGENATDEDKRAFQYKMGLPENKEDYKLLKEGEESQDKEFFDAFKTKAYELGIMPKQARALIDFYGEHSSAQLDVMDTKNKQGVADGINNLKTEWGDTYDGNINLAQRAIQTYADENFVNLLNESGMGNNPQMIKLFANVGKAMGEDTLKGDSIPGNGKLSPEEAQKQINTHMNDMEGPYHNSDHANHEIVNKEVQELFALIG